MSLPRFPVRSRCLVFAAALGLVPGVVAQCGSTVSIPAFNTTWTLQGSPYCVTQTLQVGHLTIDPGVEVRLAPGASLQVVSWLRALGTRAEPVTFRAQNLAGGRWGGIEFAGPVSAGFSSLLQNCVITEANNSGVRILDNDQVSLVGCVLRDNSTALDGGGLSVSLSSGHVGVIECDIESNAAARNGGGVAITTTGTAVVSLTECRVRSNTANSTGALGMILGGGIFAAGNLTLNGCNVTANILTTYGCSASPARGGGVFASSGDVHLLNTLVMGNRVAVSGCNGITEGGGIYAANTVGTLRLDNSLVCCNTNAPVIGTASSGSGICTHASSTQLNNCTIARNSHDGLRVAAGSATVSNSIVYFHPTGNIVGTATVTWSDIQGGHPGTGNVNLNPAFVGSGCLPEHFALSFFSPCIDAGDPTGAANDACRPPGQGTPRNDIGALGGSGNCGFSGPSVVTCGVQTYGELKQGLPGMTLDWTFLATQPPFTGTLSIANGFAQSPGLVLLAFDAGMTTLAGVTLLVDAGASLLPIALDANGGWSTTLNLQLPFLVGVPVFLQALALPASGQTRASNGLRLAPCF